MLWYYEMDMFRVYPAHAFCDIVEQPVSRLSVGQPPAASGWLECARRHVHKRPNRG